MRSWKGHLGRSLLYWGHLLQSSHPQSLKNHRWSHSPVPHSLQGVVLKKKTTEFTCQVHSTDKQLRSPGNQEAKLASYLALTPCSLPQKCQVQLTERQLHRQDLLFLPSMRESKILVLHRIANIFKFEFTFLHFCLCFFYNWNRIQKKEFVFFIPLWNSNTGH